MSMTSGDLLHKLLNCFETAGTWSKHVFLLIFFISAAAFCPNIFYVTAVKGRRRPVAAEREKKNLICIALTDDMAAFFSRKSVCLK